MQEYMLYIRNRPGNMETSAPEKHAAFLQECKDYIGKLTAQGKLIAAQPIVREGVMLWGKDGEWHQGPYNETGEVNVGYYHILANDMEEAIAIAKENPEFKYTDSARIEVRPVKMKEVSTGFVYPK